MYRKPREETAFRSSPADDIRRFFAIRDRFVLSFAGFGELGYEEDGVVERVLREAVRDRRPDELIVNSGTLLRVGGQDGIARVYEHARGMGIETSGIHPSVALDFAETHRVSPFEQHVFFVEDTTWGGLIEGAQELSPTLRVILDVTDELIVIGGGKHAADELTAFLRHEKTVRYYPAEMNHSATKEWSERAGVVLPNLHGAARDVWLARRQMQADG